MFPMLAVSNPLLIGGGRVSSRYPHHTASQSAWKAMGSCGRASCSDQEADRCPSRALWFASHSFPSILENSRGFQIGKSPLWEGSRTLWEAVWAQQTLACGRNTQCVLISEKICQKVSIKPLLFSQSSVYTHTHTRSEERRVGKECTVVCRSRWSPYH